MTAPIATEARVRPQQGPTSTIRRPSAWTLVQIVLLVTVVTLLYFRILADLAEDWWMDPGASQGLLIPPLALYMAWLRRDITLSRPKVADAAGLIACGIACLTYLVGRLGAEFFLSRLSFVMLLAALIWTFWGRIRLRTLALPLLLLTTMIPLPQMVFTRLSLPLQLFASSMATSLVQIAGVTVHRDGNLINLAEISLGVSEACNGLNSLSALVVASILISYMVLRRNPLRFTVILSSLPISVFLNVIRIAGTAIGADYHTELALGFFHVFSGWLIFVVGFTSLYGVAIVLRLFQDRRLA